MRFRAAPNKYLIANKHSDLCAIALLYRFGMRRPTSKELAEKTYMQKIQPILDALRSSECGIKKLQEEMDIVLTNNRMKA